MTSAGEIEQLPESTCMRLLATVRVGRVALTQRALPVVLPVSFVLDSGSIVIQTVPGSVLATSRDGVVLAFEAGELDPDTGSGWSVLVTGTMQKIIDPDAIRKAQQLGPTPWTSDDRHDFVCIEPGLVSGSRVEHRPRYPDAAASLA